MIGLSSTISSFILLYSMSIIGVQCISGVSKDLNQYGQYRFFLIHFFYYLIDVVHLIRSPIFFQIDKLVQTYLFYRCFDCFQYMEEKLLKSIWF